MPYWHIDDGSFMKYFPPEAGDQKFSENNHLSVISVDDALKLLRNICSKKSTGMDKIPPKLTKKSKADH